VAVIRDGPFLLSVGRVVRVLDVDRGERSSTFSPVVPVALSHGAVVSQVLAAGALHPVACRLTVNLRGAALARGLWCPVCGITPF